MAVRPRKIGMGSAGGLSSGRFGAWGCFARRCCCGHVNGNMANDFVSPVKGSGVSAMLTILGEVTSTKYS